MNEIIPATPKVTIIPARPELAAAAHRPRQLRVAAYCRVFIDGESFFGDIDRHFCTCDRCHPNDLGFYRMAAVVEPVVKEILETRYPNS